MLKSKNTSGVRKDRNVPDYTGDRYWAGVLAKRLQLFWQRAGYRNVRVWVETETTSFDNKYYSVRSNIVFNCNDLTDIDARA